MSISPESHPLPATLDERPAKLKFAPDISGPLSRLNDLRPEILKQVNLRTLSELETASNPDLVLGEALYQERMRLRKKRPNFIQELMTGGRAKKDAELWLKVQKGLRRGPSEASRVEMMRDVVHHYSDEIGGRFNDKVYRFATSVLPVGFNWLLNAASVRQFLPWKYTESLQDRLKVYGEIEHLKRLMKKGTILLVPTHQSNLDSILIGYVIALMGLPPFSYGAGLNLFSNPILSFFMSNLGAYTVDRQKNNAIYKATLKNYSTEILKQGVHSIFFPAGGRVRSGAIESHLKLGLLGTALQAQLENLQEGAERSSVYVVPMVTSYHFVLEASSLIDEYLEQAGKHRFIGTDDSEPWLIFKVLNFFWTLFAAQAEITVRVGRPLDVFGNLVDEEGRSIGPNGTMIDPKRWLTTRGELRADEQRDREYTAALGEKLVIQYHKENVVLTSHLLAFSYFRALRKQYPDLDLYKFLRISRPQRTLPYERLLQEAEFCHRMVMDRAAQGGLHLSEELRALATRAWIEDGAKKLGIFHGNKVLEIKDGLAWSEDMNLLYYYRNRLTGYGFPSLSDTMEKIRGEYDQKGFLV